MEKFQYLLLLGYLGRYVKDVEYPKLAPEVSGVGGAQLKLT